MSKNGFFNWSESRKELILNDKYCLNILREESKLKHPIYIYTTKIFESLENTSPKDLYTFFELIHSFLINCKKTDFSWKQEMDFENIWGPFLLMKAPFKKVIDEKTEYTC